MGQSNGDINLPDWEEATVGRPFLSLDRLHDEAREQAADDPVCEAYLENLAWHTCEALERVMCLVPLERVWENRALAGKLGWADPHTAITTALPKLVRKRSTDDLNTQGFRISSILSAMPGGSLLRYLVWMLPDELPVLGDGLCELDKPLRIHRREQVGSRSTIVGLDHVLFSFRFREYDDRDSPSAHVFLGFAQNVPSIDLGKVEIYQNQIRAGHGPEVGCLRECIECLFSVASEVQLAVHFTLRDYTFEDLNIIVVVLHDQNVQFVQIVHASPCSPC